MLQKINFLDEKILLKLNSWASHNWTFLNKLFAQYLIYALPILLIVLWFWDRKSKKVALRALAAALLAWPILAKITGHFLHRARPFNTAGVQELLFHRPDYSFPSDHAAAIFAVAMSFWFSGYRKLSIVCFVVGLVISFFRVATAIHWPTDILGGLALGLLAGWLIYLFDKPLDIVYNFMIKIAQKLRLA